mmetsp:Transcript_12719/g.26774  ORF Transcript_12719/g.26774 Transcript_12719/m.26774 type:complete len:123 (+) Transcript_12719:462-830(+)
MRYTGSDLSSESVKSLSLTLEGIHHIHGSDSLTTGVLGVSNGVADNVLEENFQDTTGFLIDETGDTLDTSTTGEAADGGLGNALDVVAKDLSVTLGASLSKTFASFSTAGHDYLVMLFAESE